MTQRYTIHGTSRNPDIKDTNQSWENKTRRIQKSEIRILSSGQPGKWNSKCATRKLMLLVLPKTCTINCAL